MQYDKSGQGENPNNRQDDDHSKDQQPEPLTALGEITGANDSRVEEHPGGDEIQWHSPATPQQQRNKTDKANAALIVEFCQKENPLTWEPLPAYVKHLRALVRGLDDLQSAYQQERNRLHSGEKDAWVLDDLQTHLSYLKSRIQAARQAMQQHIERHPLLRSQQELLISIPGIGKLTAARLLAEISDINAFENAPQLAAYAGLNPKSSRSGSSVRNKTRISKEGRAFLRYILYMPAIVARKHNPIIIELCRCLADRKPPEMAIVIAAIRKLLHIIFGVLKNQTPFDPDHGKQFAFTP